MLIEIHMIQNHAPSNLNRDDTGSPKDCVFGGVRRSRISSQCIKRSIRKSEIFERGLDGIELGIRTRRLPELVEDALLDRGFPEDVAHVAGVKATGFGNKKGKEQEGDLKTAQIMFFSSRDVQAVIDVMAEVAREAGSPDKLKKVGALDLQRMAELKGWRPVSPDIALFGRMITSKAFRDVEASIQVAHAVSTNEMVHEWDYYTAVDDLRDRDEEEDDTGAGMIGDVEFNSACYYKYFSLDFPALVSNLAGPKPTDDDLANARQTAARTCSAFLKAAALVTPTGKQNTFAAHQLPDGILVEVRPTKIPVSYANAFVKPVVARHSADLVEASMGAFASHVDVLTKSYCLESQQRLWFSTRSTVIPGTRKCDTFNEMIRELESVVGLR